MALDVFSNRIRMGVSDEEVGMNALRLRTVCRPDEVMDGQHKHFCEECGTCWRHGDDMPLLSEAGLISHEEFVLAHHCPECGAQQRYKFRPEHDAEDFLVMRLALRFAARNGRH